MTENDKLILGVETETLLKNATARESWRIFGIMSEFVEATERLAAIKPAVTMFGSARVRQDSPYYKSDTFMDLLRKVTQNPGRFVLKQHNNRLAMTVRNVKDIEDGYKTLQQL